MSGTARSPATLELSLARLLSLGTWIACVVMAVGTLAALLGWSAAGARIDTVGIGLFIALPVVRLLAMMIAFLRSGDGRFSAICALVVLIIALGTAAGLLIRS